MSTRVSTALALVAMFLTPLYGCVDRPTAPALKSATTTPELARDVAELEPFDLGTLPPPSFSRMSRALAMNPSGDIVGWSTVPNPVDPLGRHAALWRNGSIVDLGTLGGYESIAYGINSAGVIVGASMPGHDVAHAFAWRDGTMSDLGTLCGADRNSVAYGIDPSGRIVGQSDTCGSDQPVALANGVTAVLWQEGTMIALGTLGGATSAAYAISPSGVIVGSATTAVGNEHAFIWRDGAMRDLGTLGGASSAALAINAAGDVVGWSTTQGGAKHAVVWPKGAESIADLGTLGRRESVATGINAAGQIVGYFTGSPSSGAFIWQRGVMMELPDGVITPGFPLGPGSAHAFAISAAGDVVGDVRTFLSTHAGLWTRR